jgi:DNA helicase-2/ATP-dependent DNA helicase PcrA
MTSAIPAFLSGLNEPQLEAVTLPHQSSLILAGAGSGKTRVLTTRIAWLIQTGQASPHGLLGVTFTNKAAKEMLTRISAMLPINTRGMWVGTFHGLCNRMLRTHYREAGLPQLFQILDSQDQLALIKRLMKQLNIDDERYPPRQAQWFINNAKDEGRRAKDVEPFDEFSRRMTEFYVAYDAQCQREGVVDFAELLLRSYELLARNEVLREHYRARFKHILVDEFQDTNRLQYRWLQQLSGAESCIFAVGDDDQSIYAFRGASSANMQDLQKDFHIEKVIKLEQNYRSHGHILDAANALIHHNQRRLGKNSGRPRARASHCVCMKRQPIWRRLHLLLRRSGRCATMASRSAIWRCYTDPTRSRVSSSTPCSTHRYRTACMAAYVFLSARKSNMHWRIYGWWRNPMMTARY